MWTDGILLHLRIGEYTKKASRQMTKRTVQFRMKDVAFFVLCKRTNHLKLLAPDASDEDILSADAATLKLRTRKMVGKTSASINTGMGTYIFVASGHRAQICAHPQALQWKL